MDKVLDFMRCKGIGPRSEVQEESRPKAAPKKMKREQREDLEFKKEGKKEQKKEQDRLKKEADRKQKEQEQKAERRAEDSRRKEEQKAAQRLRAEESARDELLENHLAEAVKVTEAFLQQAQVKEKWCEVAAKQSADKHVSPLLLAAAALPDSDKKKKEHRIDAQLVSLGGFFILGARESELEQRIGKIRKRLQEALESKDFGDLSGYGQADEAALERRLASVATQQRAAFFGEETALDMLRKRVQKFEHMSEDEVRQAARRAAEKDEVRKMLQAAKYADKKEDAILASLGAVFELGISLPESMEDLRKRIRKVREGLRRAVSKKEFGELPGNGEADHETLSTRVEAARQRRVLDFVVPPKVAKDVEAEKSSSKKAK